MLCRAHRSPNTQPPFRQSEDAATLMTFRKKTLNSTRPDPIAQAYPIKVLLIQDQLPAYRIPIFSQIAQLPGICLTVAHASESAIQDDEATNFQLLPFMARRGRIFVRSDLKKRIRQDQFQVVVVMFNMRWIELDLLTVRGKRNFAVILWGIGVGSAQGYGSQRSLNRLRVAFARRADAVILYSSHAMEVYRAHGVKESRIFVAENTVYVPEPRPLGAEGSQASLLFLGSLRPDKGVTELLEAYAVAHSQFIRRVDIDIVGDGPARAELEAQATSLGISSRVHFHGALYSTAEQEPFFARAVACISPRQAGLSVLLSMAHGVPFVTRSDAVTGGERFNIKSGENGIEYSGGPDELAHHLITLVNNPQRTSEMGLKAVAHYLESATSAHMVDVFRRAIATVTENPL